jgi:hypothetical protein
VDGVAIGEYPKGLNASVDANRSPLDGERVGPIDSDAERYEPVVGFTPAGSGQDSALEFGGRFLGTDRADPWEDNSARLNTNGIGQPKVV